MADLRLEHVAKAFTPTVPVLDDISLSVKSSECLAIVGPSGCGKTTLLRIIAGLEQPTSGNVYIDDRLVNHVPSDRRGVTMLFQRPALIPNKTVRESLRWATALRGPWFGARGDRAQEETIQRMAHSLAIEEDLNRPVRELSGGQQQRVALGRCLLRDATLCLLDEPLGHLDATLRTDLRRKIVSLYRENALTVLFVTHDPAEAFAVGDRVALMQRGRIIQVDEPAELRRRPANLCVVELLNHGAGGMNSVAGELSNDADGWQFDSPFGSWVFRPQELPSGPSFPQNLEKLLSHKRKIHIIIGIAAQQVACSTERSAIHAGIQLTLPVARQEFSANGWYVVGRTGQSQQWVGRAEQGKRYLAGHEVTMMFSIRETYGFERATGETLWAPTG